MRVDLAFKAFFRWVKAGENPGYPWFKRKGRYDSFTYPQFGLKHGENVLHLSTRRTGRRGLPRALSIRASGCAISKTRISNA
jgi:hypothetical protein